jgi:hypothetical protein
MEIWGDTVEAGTCLDDECRARVTFAVNVKTGRRNIFTGRLVALRTERDPASGREIWIVDASDSHFATCPGAERFRQRRTGR